MINVETSPFKSMVVTSEGNSLRVDEGDKIKFTLDTTGEIVTGLVTKLSGKGDKVKIQIMPYGSQKEEIYNVDVIAEESLVLDTDAEDKE